MAEAGDDLYRYDPDAPPQRMDRRALYPEQKPRNVKVNELPGYGQPFRLPARPSIAGIMDELRGRPYTPGQRESTNVEDRRGQDIGNEIVPDLPLRGAVYADDTHDNRLLALMRPIAAAGQASQISRDRLRSQQMVDEAGLGGRFSWGQGIAAADTPLKLAMNSMPVQGYPPWPKPVPDAIYEQPDVRDGTMDPLQLHDFYRGASPEQLDELMRRYRQRNQERAPHVPPPPSWDGPKQ